jgi:hypothetical protein
MTGAGSCLRCRLQAARRRAGLDRNAPTTIRLRVHRQLVQSIPLDDADIESVIRIAAGHRLHETHRRPIDLLKQIGGDGPGESG